jgi:hypothetical protein
MLNLTPEGEKLVAAIAERYRIGIETAKQMLDAVARGGGAMAQFNAPELGGNGQWMRGGMTMVGDMFNNSLKATVDNLCSELSNLLSGQTAIFAPVSQQQSQGGDYSFAMPGSSFQSSGGWWPPELGVPSSTGAQNDVRYAYFPQARRLALDAGGRVEVYDTLDHAIQGFGQQQGGGSTLTFTSQHGLVRVDRLPRVSVAGDAGVRRDAGAQHSQEPHRNEPAASADSAKILSLLGELAQLKEKGILTEEEFASKKAELLKRL